MIILAMLTRPRYLSSPQTNNSLSQVDIKASTLWELQNNTTPSTTVMLPHGLNHLPFRVHS